MTVYKLYYLTLIGSIIKIEDGFTRISFLSFLLYNWLFRLLTMDTESFNGNNRDPQPRTLTIKFFTLRKLYPGFLGSYSGRGIPRVNSPHLTYRLLHYSYVTRYTTVMDLLPIVLWSLPPVSVLWAGRGSTLFLFLLSTRECKSSHTLWL